LQVLYLDIKVTTQHKKNNLQPPWFSILWLIPILFLGYIGWFNLLPFGGTVNYCIDVGGEDDTGTAKITGPFERLSPGQSIEGISFRELKKQLVYFTFSDPLLSSASEVSVKVRFKDFFPGNSTFRVGAQNSKDGGYSWKEGYIPFYGELHQFNLVAADQRGSLYAARHESNSEFQSLDDFLNNPPLGSSIATDATKLDFNYHLGSEEMLHDYFNCTDDHLPVSVVNRELIDVLLIDSPLRGGHTFWTFVNNGSLKLTVIKQDLNWYEDSDQLNVSINSPDEALIAGISIPDDGETGVTKINGPLQKEELTVEDLKPGVYRIDFKGGNDLLIRGLAINQKKLVVEGDVFLAGTNKAYFKDPEVNYVSLFTHNFKAGKVLFRTSHNSGLQHIEIRGRGSSSDVDIDSVHMDFPADLKAGSYRLTFPVQDILIKHQGYFSFTPDSYFLPQRIKVTNMKYDSEWLRENMDYFLVNPENYLIPQDDNGWLVMQTVWQRDELFITGNSLNFCLNVPHLSQIDNSEKIIPIDWIKIRTVFRPLTRR